METNDSAQPSLVSHAVKFGAILAAISIVLVLVIYAIDYTMLVGLIFIGIAIVVGFGFVVYAGINYRNSIGGYIDYGPALMHAMILFTVSGLIGSGFNLLLYNVIDPDLPQNLTEVILRNTEEMMTKFNAPQDQVDAKIAELETEIPKGFTTVGLLIGFLKTLIWYAVLSLIIGLSVRKRKPETF